MKLQFNGCYYSDPIICPNNWKSGGKSLLKKNWYVYYRYHDPLFKDRYPEGKSCPIKGGVNRYKTLEERREAIQELFEIETQNLERGYNPITKMFMSSDPSPGGDRISVITEMTPLTEALQAAAKLLKVDPDTTGKDIRSVLRYFGPAAAKLRYAQLPIKSVTRKHIRYTLEQVGIEKGEKWTDSNFNFYRSYLMMLFTELVELEVINGNPLKEIRKRKGIERIRETLSFEERILIDKHLRVKNFEFWKYMHIFFHSGSRITELMRVKGEHVDLKRQRIKFLVKKGNAYREVYRPIKDIVMPIWRLIMSQCEPGDYVFSVGLKPGESAITAHQITRRWNRWVKKPKHWDDKTTKITCDMYSLKHSNTDEIADHLNLDDAAALNSHSKEIARKVYAVNEAERQRQRIQKVRNEFAPGIELQLSVS